MVGARPNGTGVVESSRRSRCACRPGSWRRAVLVAVGSICLCAGIPAIGGEPGGNDCDGDGSSDAEAVAGGLVRDRNGNGIPDACDIASGASRDIDGNGVPDEAQEDCDRNGVPDRWEIEIEGRADRNRNGVLDECDIRDGASLDANVDGVPDEAERDEDANGVPDDLDIARGDQPDCDGDGRIDSFSVRPGPLSLGERVRYPSGLSPVLVVAGDIDRDGLPEIVAADRGGTTVALYRNDRATGLRRRWDVPVPGVTRRLVLGRLDGDPFLDLVAVGDLEIWVLLGTWDASFEEPIREPRETFETGDYAVLGDVDSDGRDDLLMIGSVRAGRGVSVRLGLGNGRFQAPFVVPDSGGISGFVLSDLDGDDVLDMAGVGAGIGRAQIFLGVGTGEFRPQGEMPVETPFTAVAGDFDSSGALDLAILTSRPERVQVFLDPGHRSLLSRFGIDAIPGARGLVLLDADADGHLDLATWSTDLSSIQVFRGDGRGEFEEGEVLLSTAIVSLAVADVDGDGRDDLVSGKSLPEDSIDVHDFTRPRRGATRLFREPGSFRLVHADFDGDGVVDFAASSESSVTVVLGRLDGGYAPPVTYAIAGEARHMTTGDFTRDGLPDLALSTRDRGLWILPNVGGGAFGPPSEIATDGQMGRVVAGDFDGDGGADLLAFLENPDVGRLWSSGGDGTLRDVGLDLPRRADDVVADDFDRDGALDVAVAIANLAPTNLVVYRGRGDGRFRPARTYPLPGSGLTRLTAADFDGDGSLDIVASLQSSQRVAILRGDGTGGFLAALPVRTPFPSPLHVAVGDFSRDGALDIAVAYSVNLLDSGYSVLLGDGAGGVSGGVSHRLGDLPADLAVDDFDGDAVPDLALLHRSPFGLQVHHNATAPADVPDCDRSGTPDACDIAEGRRTDVDRDGVPDECAEARQVLGDCNQDGRLDISDPTCVLGALFLGVPAEFPCAPQHRAAANLALLDWEDNGDISLTDAIRMLTHLFSGAPGATSALAVGTDGCVAIPGCPSGPGCGP